MSVFTTILASLLLQPMTLSTAESQSNPNTIQASFVPPDCGEVSLNTILRLQGFPVSYESIRRHLPPQSDRGYSFTELKAASDAMGVPVTGIEVRLIDEFPTEPAIAALWHDGTGHFVCVHPIPGSSLIQVYDPLEEPYVTNSDRLMEDHQWTGRMLVRKRPFQARNDSMGISCTAIATIVLIVTLTRVYSARTGQKLILK